MLTYDFLNECLTYNPETGIFRWKIRPVEHFKDERMSKSWNTKYSLNEAGNLNRHTGYLGIVIGGKGIRLHRAAFLMSYGYMPELIDHVNGVKTDNRILNLREATYSQNSMNKNIQSNNSSGQKGVDCIKNGRWRARIHVDRKEIHLGYFINKEDAIKTFLEAEEKYHGQFALSCRTS